MCILPICNEYFLQILELFYLKYIIFNNESIISILKYSLKIYLCNIDNINIHIYI
jgi:hypothetical protein